MKNQQLLRFGLSLVLGGALALTAGTAIAATFTYNFSAISGMYHVGDVLNPSGAKIKLQRFQWGNGTWTAAGVAKVSLSNNASGSPTKELNLNNINVRVIPNTPASSATFLYADLGGNINFGVNGDFRNSGDLISLNGTVVGNCNIAVTPSSVTITPQDGVMIKKFGMGGQEFWIDDITFSD